MMVTTILSPYVLLTLLILKAKPGAAMLAREAPGVPEALRRSDPTLHPSWRLLEHTRCGLSAADRIIGGKNAALGAYPWIARIGYTGGRRRAVFRCGAVLINSYYVVTAAHCVTNLPNGLEVGIIRLGEHNTRTDPDCEAGVCADPVQDFLPAEVLVHADYGKPAFKNDISLVRLDRAAELHDFVMPICMIHGKLLTKNYVGEPTEVAGWGVYDIAALLAAAQAQLVESCLDFCKNVYRPVCAGDPAGGTVTRQFRNACELRSFNCRNKTRLKIISEGRCKREKGTNKNNEQNEQVSSIENGSNR